MTAVGVVRGGSSRPLDWSPLAPADPVPGDPDEVLVAAARHRDVADAVAAAEQGLRRVATAAAMRSRAVEAFREQAWRTGSDLTAVLPRLRGAAEALSAYATSLADAQAESVAALRLAQEAEDSRRVWLDAADAATAALRDAVLLPPVTLPGLTPPGAVVTPAEHDARVALARAHDRLVEADADLAAARRRCETAVDDRDAAAGRASRALADLRAGDGLDDPRWSGLEDVATWTGRVAAVAGTAAAVLALVPVLAPLAGVLAGLALAAAAVNLLVTLVLRAEGRATSSDVAWSAVGVATLGGGRALVPAIRAARAAVGPASVPVTRAAPRAARPAVRSAPRPEPAHRRASPR
ncbi:hypothetical protein, partial [Aquipuribacter nitratireducens]